MQQRPTDRRPPPPGGARKPTGTRFFRSWPALTWVLVLAVLFAWLSNRYGPGGGPATPIDYSKFREMVAAGRVARITVSNDEITGRLKQAERAPSGNRETEFTEFVTYLPSFGDDELFSLLQANQVAIRTEPANKFSTWALLANLMPLLFLLGIGYLLITRMRQQGMGVFSMGQSRAKLYEQSDKRTTFEDVAGLEGVKVELEEIVDYLKAPDRVVHLGGTPPKGILMVGPPGTGKTLLARAVAGEANVPFFSITGSDFMEMFVGIGASRVRNLFENARKAAPCIIFIDELDSIGRRRGAGLGGGHDEREQTLNQLLSELDGFQPTENVVVMAATNRPDILDPALLRPGRFDRRITVDLPTVKGRERVLAIHARNKPLAPDADLAKLARGTPGFSGADLENILNEAALLAARRKQKVIGWKDIEEARDKVLLGLVREGLALTREECELIAYHEGGHALLAALLPHADPIHKVTIVPRGQAMGVTQQLPEKERYIYKREYLMDRLSVALAGRAAEDLVFGTVTSGAEHDLKQATQLARKMVLDWGMSKRWGHMALGGRREHVFLGEEIAERREYSEATASEVDEEIASILEEAYDRSLDALRSHRRELDLLTKALLEREEIPGEEVLAIVGVRKKAEETTLQ
ncbi:MAG: ATP-dependent zinc metalloprotease FtsH [bacterium]